MDGHCSPKSNLDTTPMTLEFVRLSVVTVPLVSVAILMNSEIFLLICRLA
jgi:hypothetical protein